MTTGEAPRREASSLLLVLWVAGLAAAIAVLTLAGRGALGAPSILDPAAWQTWASGRDAVTLAFAAVRLLTLGLAWYLLGVTVIGAVARLGRWRRFVIVADALTVPAVRRLLQSALGVGLATAALTVGSPPAAQPASPPTAATMTLAGQHGATRAVMTPLSGTDTVMRQIVAPPPHSEPSRWTVAPGDHLWSIAVEVLTSAWGRPPSDDEVVGYWEELVATNRQRLVDPGNADLIYPGQRFTLPPTPEPPRRQEPSR